MAFLLDFVFERAARHILHDDIVRLAVHTDIKDIDDIRMTQPGSCLCFTMEAVDEFRIALELFMQDLHRYRTIQQQIFCLIDIGHTAAANELLELIALI